MLRGSQLEGATEVLRAAAMTYLAAAATAVLQLVYFLMLSED
ncbi:MAG TPA: zinc metallopeptidase [Myxococcota bacterium]|nr:zinc metallopeptidase [Myxococcota bacterium]